MELHPTASKALDGWIRPETWHTNHPLDMRRFFSFVVEYAKQHGHALDEASLREEIVRRLKLKADVSRELMRIIQERLILAYSILDLLKQTNR